MERYPDWAQRLWQAIEARRANPHRWGVNDCCLYVADMIEAQTGEDPAKLFRDKYSDEAGAWALLRAHGITNLTELADASLPRRTKRPRRGDVILKSGPKGEFLGVVSRSGWITASSSPRPLTLPIGAYIACWSVGDG